MTELTKKDKPFKWTDKCEEAFQKLKEVLTGAEVMGYPKNDCQFVLDTDTLAWVLFCLRFKTDVNVLLGTQVELYRVLNVAIVLLTNNFWVL